ncbi:hypothetical protein B296_00005742 [Ensete ventricosum]|uniref:Uncharacterized protein n=1 Tax=Ensete ventricosum TaxID=4639 RepID=A0A426YMK5_ENSVE|nr:hypothetical protein B296_00005742 [Ensete ventricosum]
MVVAKAPPVKGEAAARGHGRLQCGAHKGRPLVASSHGAIVRGQDCHQQRQQCRSQGRLPLSRATVSGQGQPSPTQGSVEVIAGPIVSMQEITMHGDATRIRRNR